MIKHLFTIIWNQRSGNIWIFLELLLVTAILWVMADSLLVDTYTYQQPLGYDITNTYSVEFNKEYTSSLPDSLQDNKTDSENLLRLIDNLRHCPEVEAVSLSSGATPYTFYRRYRNGLILTDDTTYNPDIWRWYLAAPDYCRVFRLQTPDGKPLYNEVMNNPGTLIIPENVVEGLFGTSDAVGKMVKQGVEDNPKQITAVMQPMCEMEFDKARGHYLTCLKTEQEILDLISDNSIYYVECVLRMKDGFNPENMNAFLQAQGDRLQTGDVYVSTMKPISEYRSERLKPRLDNQKKKIAMVAFMLVNIFFGIVGTFWLRTQSRRAEIGLRAALGASKRQLQKELFMEGVILLALTLPFLLIFLINMLYLDMPDTYRLEYTWWRFLITVSVSYLLMGSMIYFGIRIPARKIMRMNPAETLHYE